MLTLIVNSLYESFVVAEDGSLFLNPEFREGIKVTISSDLLENIRNLDATVQAIAPSIEALWSGSGKTDTDTFAQIGKNILRLKAFTLMIDPDSYKEYIKTPYKLDPDAKNGALPLIDPETNLLVQTDPKAIEKIKNTKALSNDPRIEELKKIWPDADAGSLSIEEENIRVQKAPYKI
jgi:hypothetical protein